MAPSSYGTAADGFAVSFDRATRQVSVVAYGFWAPDVADRFAAAVAEACRASAPVELLAIDATDLKPQREEGQASVAALLAALPTLRVARATILTTNALTRLQLLRLVKASNARGIVEMVPPRAA